MVRVQIGYILLANALMVAAEATGYEYFLDVVPLVKRGIHPSLEARHFGGDGINLSSLFILQKRGRQPSPSGKRDASGPSSGSGRGRGRDGSASGHASSTDGQAASNSRPSHPSGQQPVRPSGQQLVRITSADSTRSGTSNGHTNRHTNSQTNSNSNHPSQPGSQPGDQQRAISTPEQQRQEFAHVLEQNRILRSMTPAPEHQALYNTLQEDLSQRIRALSSASIPIPPPPSPPRGMLGESSEVPSDSSSEYSTRNALREAARRRN